MTNINQVELQNLRHLIMSANVCNTKLTSYASIAVDPQIKQLFTKVAQDSINTKETLLTFLSN